MNTKILFFVAVSVVLFTAANAQTAGSQKKASSQSGSQNAAVIFNGAWRTVDNKGFSVMYDGNFNSVAQDSTGQWKDVHAGTYTVNNDNSISFKILYSSFPDHIGAVNTAEYSISGETLKLRHFKKLIDAQGKDITDQMPKDAWETSTRVK